MNVKRFLLLLLLLYASVFSVGFVPPESGSGHASHAFKRAACRYHPQLTRSGGHGGDEFPGRRR